LNNNDYTVNYSLVASKVYIYCVLVSVKFTESLQGYIALLGTINESIKFNAFYSTSTNFFKIFLTFLNCFIVLF